MIFRSRRKKIEDNRWFVVRRHNRSASVPEDVQGIDGLIQYLKTLSASGKIEDYEIVINYRDTWEVAERQELDRLKKKYESEEAE